MHLLALVVSDWPEDNLESDASDDLRCDIAASFAALPAKKRY